MAEFASSDVMLLRRNRLLIAVGVAPLLLGLFLIVLRSLLGDLENAGGVDGVMTTLCVSVGALSGLFVLGGGSDIVSSDPVLVRRDRWKLALALATVLMGQLLLLWGAWGAAEDESAAWLLSSILCTLAGVLSICFMVWASPSKIAVPGAFSADEHSVRFSGRVLASLQSLRAGFLVLTGSQRPLVRLERRWPDRPIELQVDEAKGRALLRALGFDASQVVASFTFASRARADERLATVGCLMPVLAFAGLQLYAFEGSEVPGLFAYMLLGFVMLIVGWTILMSMPTRVVVGADGVFVSWFWRKRFVNHGELRAVRQFSLGRYYGIALWPAAGTPVKLPFKRGLDEQERDLIIQRIQQAIASHHDKEREREIVLPERGQRPLREWIQQLRAIGSGANADHRTAPIAREELFRVIEDPSAAPVERARAAIAIGCELDDGGRTRLRVAAEATAAPEVRAVLELSAEEADEEQIAKALARIPSGGRQAAG